MMWFRIAIVAACFAAPTVATVSWTSAADERLALEERAASGTEDGVVVASAANEEYCTVDLKRVLRRVLKSCGLLGAEGGTLRGCQPLDAKQVATMDGGDFNALFSPMEDRGGIIQFDQGKAELDDQDRALLDEVFANRAGASYFFIVARASPEGTVERNRELSKERAEVLMGHLRDTFKDPGLEEKVGLLWLGEEFAQLDADFCTWQRSGDDGTCTADDINRTAFVAWIDCRL